ncbi:facilitated trehalose transporter Tret1-like [Plodia interpunctella]|uniref:facilitated trehalose transporter Tret1-like n=1 Tax=Plodia interpunctella TaxID=58824 RepID=UPI002368C790|nr:facilitated trehalose transporter Tret1-like [Plodia interpunctella]XP_053617847.1 facilitated trehalose transporter Tret1-like [Plodia interpunctella]
MKGLLIQVISGIILGLGCMGFGVSFAWPSTTLLLFKSENTTLNRPMSESEAALFGSLSSVGGMIGNPLMAVLLGRLGRKYSAILSTCVGLIAWTLVVFSSTVEVILTAIFLFGVSGSVMLVVPVYISEFCQENIRGIMTSLFVVFNGLGMLVSILLGSILSYHTMTYVFLVMSGAGVVLLSILKESPVVFMQKGKEEEAKKSVAYYRSWDPNSKEVMQEIEKIKRALNPDLDEDKSIFQSPEEEKLNPENPSIPQKPLTFMELLRKSRSTRRAMVVLLVLITAAIFQGLVVVVVYAIPLFSQVVPADVMSPALCSVLLCGINVVSSLLGGFLTDKAGRRMLIIVASFLTGTFCVIIGILIISEWGPKWLIAVFIYLYSISYTVGAGTVPFVMMAEVLLPEVKGYITMLIMEWAWLCNFALLYVFQSIVARYGIGPVFFVFAAISFLTSGYSIFFVPETKGLSVNVIQTLFLKKRRDLETEQ